MLLTTLRHVYTRTSPYYQACADKLLNEMEEFGFPPVFPQDSEEKEEEKEQESPDLCDPTKRAKKVTSTYM